MELPGQMRRPVEAAGPVAELLRRPECKGVATTAQGTGFVCEVDGELHTFHGESAEHAAKAAMGFLALGDLEEHALQAAMGRALKTPAGDEPERHEPELELAPELDHAALHEQGAEQVGSFTVGADGIHRQVPQ
jgi:hypothetical protein